MTPVLGPGGDVVGGTAALEDVDQAQAARDALVHSERRYRLLVQNSQDVVGHLVDGVLRWISPSVTALCGWTPDELVGHRTLHLWHPDDRELADRLRQDAAAGPPRTALLRLRCKDGHDVHVDVGLHDDGELGEHGVVLTLRDATERVAVLEALRARESEFRLIAENAGDMVMLADLEGRIEWVSPSVRRLLGVPAESMIGQTLLERLHPDDVVRREATLREVDEGADVYFEGRFRHEDGRYLWLGAHIRPVHDDVGRVVARLGVAREVSREVASRQALEEREVDYRLLAENAADIVFRLDTDGRFTWLSPSVELVLGRAPGALLGRPVDEFLHPDDRATRERAIRAASAEGRTAYEARYLHADGSYRWLAISGHPLIGSDGAVVGRVGSAREIGAEVAAREALERSEAMFRLLAENSADIVIRSDLTGVIEWASPSIRGALGWTADEVVGADFVHLLHPDDRPQRDAARDCVAGGSSATFLARYRHKDDRWVWLSVTVAPIRDADGALVGVVGSARDATAELEAQRALMRSEAMFRLLAENAADIVFRADPTMVIDWVSPSVTGSIGWDPSDFVGHRILEWVHPDDVDVVLAGHRDAEQPGASGYEVRIRRRDGSYRWFGVAVRSLLDDEGHLVARVGSARDISDAVAAREALERSESMFRMLAENATDIVLRAGLDGTLDWVSPSLHRVLGWEPDEVVGGHVLQLMHPEDAAARETARAAGVPSFVPYLARYRHKDGRWIWMSIAGAPLLDASGAMVGMLGSAREVTAEVLARQALEASEEMFRSVMDSSAVGMAVVGLDQRFLAVNPALCRLVDRDEQWFHEHLATDLAPLENRDRTDGDGTAYFRDGTRSHLDAARLLRADGSEVWVQRTVVLVRDPSGDPAYFVTQLRDISAEMQNEYRKFHDPLTGLRNRDWIVDILEEELRVARRSGSDVGVLFIDLDNFKVVNDSLGHEAGDELLATVAQRLTSSLRPGDHVGRFGGDEFVVVIPDVDQSDLGSICERVLEGIAPQMELRGHRIAPTASMGVAVSTLDSSAQSLLRDADSALYRAKSAGKQGFHFADEAMHAQAVARLTTEDELRRAVAEHELVVHYQPIVRLSDRAVVGHEALVRWQHPERGLVPPLEFLPVAEESGLIVDIGDEVLRMVSDKLAARPDLPNVSVNLSPLQTSRPWWRERLVAQLAERGVDPRRISVEVTETAVLAQVDEVARELASLRELGVGVHLDDFGTGYSSIALLRDLPITGLKLDMSFTRRLTGDGGTTEVLAGGLARLANGLGMLGIAEGVETEEQAALLLSMGWSHGQGWLFGRPQPEPA